MALLSPGEPMSGNVEMDRLRAVECGAAYATDNVAEFKKRMKERRG